MPSLSHPSLHALHGEIGRREEEEDELEYATGSTKSRETRCERTARKRGFNGETDPVLLQVIHRLQDDSSRLPIDSLRRVTRQRLRHLIGVDECYPGREQVSR